MVVLADNQRGIASALDRAGAAVALELTNHEQFAAQLQDAILHLVGNQASICNLGLAAARVTEGCGTDLITTQILGNSTP